MPWMLKRKINTYRKVRVYSITLWRVNGYTFEGINTSEDAGMCTSEGKDTLEDKCILESTCTLEGVRTHLISTLGECLNVENNDKT
ncbi:hypothetical protein Peur_074532 [Populus x canadensis]|jgi:hypothetical protein